MMEDVQDQLLKSQLIESAANAKYANRFFIRSGRDGVVRIAFADQPIEELVGINIHATIILSGPGLFTLQNHLNQFIQMQMQAQSEKQAPIENKPPREELN